MQQEQQAKSDYNFDNYKEDDVLALKRQEAKEIYKQFRQWTMYGFEVNSGVYQCKVYFFQSFNEDNICDSWIAF